MKYKAKMNKGFTLIETLVAISILLVAVTAAMTLSFQSIRTASLIKNKFVASMLAQEGIELVKNQRDSNFIENEDWLERLDACLGANPCRARLKSTDAKVNFPACGGGTCPPLQIGSNYFYGYDSGVSTIFTRTIVIREIIPDQEAEVTVTVEWQERFSPQSVTIVGNIFNWL